jgi:hypothetical protein
MAKKTGFNKVLGRQDYVVKMAINKLSKAPFKEVVTYLDFSSK